MRKDAMFDFKDKVLLLTGANGGITRAVARTFRELGARLLLTDLDEAGLAAFAKDLDPSGGDVVAARQDAGSAADAEAVAALCRERFGGLDYVVTGAGLYRDRQVGEMSDEEWRASMAVNLDGVFYTSRAAIPLLRDGGAMVHIASMAGHRGSYQHAPYAAAKGAVLTFTRTLALELAPRIRVNAVSPGLIETPMVRPLLAAQGEKLVEMTPLKRLGQPEEVARVIAFLCSDWASFVTGETIHINGGLYMAS